MEASSVRASVATSRVPGSARLLKLRSDEQLVAQFRAGNEEAFDVLHDRYRQRLFAYVRQMLPAGTRSDAEDVLQDVFVRAYFALRADARPMAARAWLYRVAHNCCIDGLRRPAPLPVELPEIAAGDLHDPMVEAARREDLARLVTDLGRLPEQQRSALLMRELEGLSYADLAAALDCTLPAVKSLLVRARMGLAEAACARDTACVEIRNDLARACDSGARASATARRHLRDCDGCRAYREGLRSTSRGIGALAPGHGPLAALLKLFGLGGGSAAAGGGAVSGGLLGGGGAAGVAAGGGAVAATATKVAVAVCCVAGLAGGAREIEQRVRSAAPTTATSGDAGAKQTLARSASAATLTPITLGRVDPALRRSVELAAPATPEHVTAPISTSPVPEAGQAPAADETIDPSGGTLAPDETPAETESTPAQASPRSAEPAASGEQPASADNGVVVDADASRPLTLEPASEPAVAATSPADTGGSAPTP